MRDLLMDKTPKDFDLSTSARPEQIKKLFRNCILIGRRFPLAHVRFGKKIIEVATFRAGDNNDSGLILHDAIWGTPEQDVLRRDFTVNGLFYDPSSKTVIDYVGGCDDIIKRRLHTIGDPKVRFKQDPVRMIRLSKFHARLGFEIERATNEALIECREEILKSSSARILEQIFTMLESGAAEPFFRHMQECGLLGLLFPRLAECLAEDIGEQIYGCLRAADSLIQQGHRPALSRDVLASCLLYPILDKKIQELLKKEGTKPAHVGDIFTMAYDVVQEIMTEAFSHFPRRMRSAIAYILGTQYRLIPTGGRAPRRARFVRQREFSLALQFFEIRTVLDEHLRPLYHTWKDLAGEQKKLRRSKDDEGNGEPEESSFSE